MAYDKGDLVRVTGAFKDPTNLDAAVDPSTVSFKFKTPALVTTTYVYGTHAQLVKGSIGNYHVDVNANEVGTWRYRWESTGVAQAAEEGTFVVEATNF